ncbi:NAD(P)-binding domain-containing protein [Acetobacter syzygii]|uniref:NAD(P)-binding domain-containing protein n=1 Tax=Acetobacter syzygii TaxID=146476 RepID=UPI0015708E01|nr:NAD(P)-binding domain-containing protein [Acetobacter syzygii]NSL93133.1 NAD(P)-binding domain-containing protein [Acetobacter syzygii]
MLHDRLHSPIFLMDREDILRAGGDNIHLAMQDVTRTIALLQDGQAGMPAEISVPLAETAGPSAKIYALPAWLGGNYQTAGVKWTAHRQIRPTDEAAAVSTTLVNCLRTGNRLGVVASEILTAVRTAAVSAIVMQSIPFDHAPRIAILGAGTIAARHLAMAVELFGNAGSAIMLWNRTQQAAHTLAAHYPRELVRVVPDLQEAMHEADIVLACTSAEHPFILRHHIHPNMLLIQAGYDEAHSDTVTAFDHICLDLWGDFSQTSVKSLFRLYREGHIARTDIAADLRAIILDNWRPNMGESVYFSSFGLNIFDIALASRIIRTTQETFTPNLTEL